jgi:hypothetical protein
MTVLEQTESGGLIYWCPGCKRNHCVNVNPENKNLPLWDWNKSLEKPTIRPSILVTMPDPSNRGHDISRCHSFITNGQIQFLSDCTHELRGKTVDLEDSSLH